MHALGRRVAAAPSTSAARRGLLLPGAPGAALEATLDQANSTFEAGRQQAALIKGPIDSLDWVIFFFPFPFHSVSFLFPFPPFLYFPSVLIFFFSFSLPPVLSPSLSRLGHFPPGQLLLQQTDPVLVAVPQPSGGGQ
jgi:hypothetical protein